MATHGKLGEFEASLEDWTSYIEHLNNYFVANDITDAGKQRAILLSACGIATYKVIRNLVAPQAPGDKNFKDIVTLVTAH